MIDVTLLILHKHEMIRRAIMSPLVLNEHKMAKKNLRSYWYLIHRVTQDNKI